MIEIHPLRDKHKLSQLYKENDIALTEDSMAIVASDKEEILGFCLFDLNSKEGYVHYISPIDDIPFADGLLRSALHVCVENGVQDVFYTYKSPEKLFETLKFIKSAEKRELDVTRLFTSCKNC